MAISVLMMFRYKRLIERIGKQMCKKKLLGGCLAACMLLLSACSKDTHVLLSDVEADTLYVSAEGSLELANVEDFASEQYNEDELKNFIDDTIRTYKETEADQKDTVVLKDFQVKNQVAKVLLAMDNAETYTKFQGVELQFLTSENIADNLVLPDTFKRVSDGKSVDKKTVLKEDGLKYLITEENLCIRVEGTIKYYADAMLTGDSEIQTTGKEVAVVIFE